MQDRSGARSRRGTGDGRRRAGAERHHRDARRRGARRAAGGGARRERRRRPRPDRDPVRSVHPRRRPLRPAERAGRPLRSRDRPRRVRHTGAVGRRRHPRRGDRGARHPATRHRHGDGGGHRRGERRLLAVAVGHHGRHRVGRHRGPADPRAQPPGLRAHQPVLRQDQQQRQRRELPERRGTERPLQQHPDRRRRQQRPVRAGRPGNAGGPSQHRAHQPRRGQRAAARGGALRRAPERLLGGRRQRHHPRRLEPLQRHRLPLQPQPGTGRPRRRRRTHRDLLRPAAGGERGRPAGPEPRLLLRQRRRPAAGDAGRLLARRVVRRRLRAAGRGPAHRRGRAHAVRLRHPGRLRRAHPREPERQGLRAFGPEPVGRPPAGGAAQPRERHRRRGLAVELPLPLHRQLLPLPQPDQLDGGPAQQHVRPRVQPGAGELSAHSRPPRAADGPLPAGHHRPRGRRGDTFRQRAVLDCQRARSGHRRDPQRPDVGAGAAPDHRRHPQRALPVPQPVHPRQLRRLRVRQPRALRAGARPVLQLQLLAHRRPPDRRPGSGSTSSGSTPATSGGCATTSR